ITESDRLAWGFRGRRRLPQQIFNDLCWLFALAGPVVLAVDQLDNVMTQAGPAGEIRLADEIAASLMSMREETVRTIIVAACIPTAWKLIREHAVNSAADRFTELELSTNMPDAGTARAIVERHLATQYDDVGFEPPHPCWPVAAPAFVDPAIGHYTPRRLLQQVEQHVRRCLDLGMVEELSRFGATTGHVAPAPPPAALQSGFDAEFARLRAAADVLAPLDPATEDEQMSTLLNVALQCYVLEQGAASAELAIDARTSVQPALHARLRRTLDEASEDEEHWSFRAIGHPNPRAVITRLRSAHLEAGIQPGVTKRHLVVIRNIAFSTGRVTTTTINEFEAAGGVVVPICEDDLRTFSALAEMTAMT
ncbi:MAG: helicase HerA domain-containing protein, partial [Stackebrandtia sp.]